MRKVSFFLFATILAYTSATTALLQNSEAPAPAPNSTLDYLVRALHGLDRALGFFQRVYRDVNLDAVIGTRIVEASFNVLLQRLDASDLISTVPPYVISHVKALRRVARDVSENATPHIMVNEPDYYADLGPILAQGLFELDYDSRDISQSALVWPHNSQEAMEEAYSDSCITELAGTKNGLMCAISNTCWRKMTALGYNRYSLSHEIFYLSLAERFGCQLEMNWQIEANHQGSLRRLHDMFCANMFDEANTIAETGFHAKDRDLFMEQAALCGMLGYRDFFSSEWLDKILSWQDEKDGCYKWSGRAPDHLDSSSSKRDAGASFGSGRIKREEKRVSRGCLCHRTTVAASALSQYVRYILEVWFSEQV